MKRILLLNYEFPPLGGGAANATLYLLKEFATDPSLEIDVVTSSVNEFRIEQFAPNVRIHFLNIGKKGNLHYQSNQDLLTYAFKAYWYSKKLMRTQSFDSCHAFFGIPCGYVAMKLGFPYIVSLRGSDVPFYNKRFYWLDVLIFKRLSRKIWKRAKAVVANSQKLKELALETSPEQKIDVIYNGVDTERFIPKDTKDTSDVLRLVSTGRLIERKGYQYLIDALESLSNVQLTLLGDGNLRNELEAYVKEKRLPVTFSGKADQERIIRALQEADVFVLPSLNEGMSNSILEAMACGLPIITTDTGGTDELIRGNGFIIPMKNSEALREAIEKCLADSDMVKDMGRKSREMAEKMGWKKVSGEYKNFYELA